MNPRSQVVLLLSSFALLLSALATAAVPDTIDYQGKVLGADNQPLSPNGATNYSMTFRIYNDLSGGTAVWSENQIVTVKDGKFSVRLGEGVPDGNAPRPALKSVFTTSPSPKYLGLTVTVGSSTPAEISPRLAFLSMPFAFASEYAANAVTANTAKIAESIVQTTGDSSLGTATMQKATVNESLTATGKVTAGEISTAGKVTAGEISTAGDVRAKDVFVTSTLNAGNLIVDGKVTAASFQGDGSLITNISLPNKNLNLQGNYLFMSETDKGKNSGISNMLRGEPGAPFYGEAYLGTSIFGAADCFYAGGLGMQKSNTPLQHVLFWGANDQRKGISIVRPEKTTNESGYMADPKFMFDIYVAGNDCPREGYRNQETMTDYRGADLPDGELRIARADSQQHFYIRPGAFGKSSDIRLKKDIKTLPSALEGVLGLRPVTYFWKNESTDSGRRPSMGFIAQELESFFPEMITTDEKGYLRIADSSFPPILVSAIQGLYDETAEESEAMQSEMTALKAENASLRKDMEDLKGRLLKLESASQ